MRRLIEYSTFAIAMAALLALSTGAKEAKAGMITDNFEGDSLSALWTQSGPGTAVLTNHPYAGAQSVLLTASSTSPWDATLTHDFGAEQYGTVSVYAQSGVLCCGSAAALDIGDIFGAGDIGAIVRTQLSDGSLVAEGGNTNYSSLFSGAGPGGWDQFEIVADTTGLTFIVDGTTVFTDASETSGFRYVDLTVWGGPGGSEYFDNFSATTVDATPEPSTVMLLGGGLLGVFLLRRQLCNAR